MNALSSPEALRPQVEAYRAAIADPIDPVGHFINNQLALFALTFCADDFETARTIGGTAAWWYVEIIKEIYANDWRGTPLDKVPASYRAHVEARRQGSSGAGNFSAALPSPDRIQEGIDQWIDSGAFLIGDASRIITNVRRYKAVGGDRLVSVMQMGDLSHDSIMRSIELFGTKVIPAIRADEDDAVPRTGFEPVPLP